MKRPCNVSFAAALLLPMMSAVALTSACDSRPQMATSLPFAPTSANAPPPVPRPPSSGPNNPVENWTADYWVSAVSGCCACGWGTRLGESGRVRWSITISDDSIELYEDLANYPTDGIPYKGGVSSQEFSAAYEQLPSGPCQFRGGVLDGRFTADGKSFEATERLNWGVGPQETVVQRRWTGSVIPGPRAYCTCLDESDASLTASSSRRSFASLSAAALDDHAAPEGFEQVCTPSLRRICQSLVPLGDERAEFVAEREHFLNASIQLFEAITQEGANPDTRRTAFVADGKHPFQIL
jgi:hypothetical protein